jgi:hypothetical protein
MARWLTCVRSVAPVGRPGDLPGVRGGERPLVRWTCVRLGVQTVVRLVRRDSCGGPMRGSTFAVR